MAGGRFDPDGDVNMDVGPTVPQPIFEVVRPPKLVSWDHASLVSWYREWNHYVTKMRHRCAVTGEVFERVVATVKGAIQPEVLDIIAGYVLRRPLESITDNEVLQLIHTRSQTLVNEFVPDVQSLVRQSLHMDLRTDDCDARIFRYFQDFTRIVEENGLQGLIGKTDPSLPGYRDRMKARCRLLIENLQPLVLKEQIQRLVELERRDCKVDDVALFDLILVHAKAQQRYHRMSKEAGATRGSQRQSSDSSAGASGPKQGAPAAKAARGNGHQDAKPSTNRNKTPPRTARSTTPPVDGCLVCHGPHWMRECPTATPEQREEALARYRELKSQNTVVIRSKVVKSRAEADTVKINNLLEVMYIPDTGAKRSVIPSCVVHSLTALQPDLPIHRLHSPVLVVVADGRPLECDCTVKVDLQLNTAAGVVNVPNVECVVMDSQEEELLLGKDVLRDLGIDVDDMLAQLAHGADFVDDSDDFYVGDDSQEPRDEDGEQNHMDRMVSEAAANGMDAAHVDELRSVLGQYPDVWQDSLRAGPPARVEPLRIQLQDGATPIRCRQRKYAPLQRQFIREHVALLAKNGLIRENRAARWASPVVPVRKPGTKDEFRLTIDYRAVNRATIPIAGTMPNPTVLMEKITGAIALAKFDMKNGFWQLPLDVASQEVLSFMTDEGVYTPLRVPQGAMDSALHFQGQMQRVLDELIPDNAQVWIDDVLLYAKTLDEFIDVLRRFFLLLHRHNLKLNAKKSTLFAREVVWCGRVISGEGVRHDPSRVSALTELPLPSTAAELQYFTCAANWLRDSIADYARIFEPLLAKLDGEKKKVGRRNRNALNVAISWSNAERAAFAGCVEAITTSAMMTFPTDEDELCVFSDASKDGFGIIVTLVHAWDPTCPVEDQQHSLVICKGGMFRGAQCGWPIIEKEAFPIIKACDELEYLLLRRKGFRLYCDHANLIYLFSPKMDVKQHVHDRLQRWSLRLLGMKYTIEHISGERNLWADIVSRWQPRSVTRVCAVQTRRQAPVAVTELSRLRPLSDDAFGFPTIADIADAQQSAARAAASLPVVREDGVLTMDHKPWIPTAAKDLLARLMVVTHCGAQGHRGEAVMVTLLSDRFFIVQLNKKVSQFVRGCLICKHVKGPRQIQRPYGPTFTATTRNEALHWDFIYLGEGFGDTAYVLVLKDSLTHFCELFPCSTPTAYVAAEALVDWYKLYGCPSRLLSDQGVHFRNLTVDHLCARLKMERLFSPVYSPWLNGTVERVNRDLLQVLRALLIDYGLDFHEWPYLLPVVQANINHSPMGSLAGHSPAELFTGLPSPSALDVVVRPTNKGEELVVVDLKDIEPQLAKLRASLAGMHKEVIDIKERKRLMDMQKKTGSICNFDIGDYVLWSRIDARLPNNKLLGQWLGPFRITEALPHAFKVEHLVTGKTYEVHGSRLKYYADSDLNMDVEMQELVTSQGIVLDVSAFVDHRFNEDLDRWELLVQWAGLQPIENSWESLDVMQNDVPKAVLQYVESTGDNLLRAQLK